MISFTLCEGCSSFNIHRGPGSCGTAIQFMDVGGLGDKLKRSGRPTSTLMRRSNRAGAGWQDRAVPPVPELLRAPERHEGQVRDRINVDGTLYTLVYARPVAVHIDPIEKKPLSHFLPGTSAFSIATAGCNLGCLFCQNWQISQSRPEDAPFMILQPAQCGSGRRNRTTALPSPY